MTTLNSRLTWRKIAVLALLASGLLVTVAPAQDRVYLKQGSPVLGEIKALDANEVRILVRNKDEQQYPIADLLKITFDGEPRELERARELMLQEQFEQALEEINKIAASSVSNPVVRQEIAFTKSYCEGRIALAGTGDKKQASSGLLAVISANRNTHHLYPIAELLGELAFSSGENARPFFDKLATAPDPVMAARGKYHLAEVELSEQKPAEAKVHFQDIEVNEVDFPVAVDIAWPGLDAAAAGDGEVVNRPPPIISGVRQAKLQHHFRDHTLLCVEFRVRRFRE